MRIVMCHDLMIEVGFIIPDKCPIECRSSEGPMAAGVVQPCLLLQNEKLRLGFMFMFQGC